MQEWVPCPRCNSKKVVQIGKIMMSIIIACLGSLVFFVIGFFIPLLFIGIPVMFLLALLNMFFSKNFLQCKDCNHTWDPKALKHNESAS